MLTLVSTYSINDFALMMPFLKQQDTNKNHLEDISHIFITDDFAFVINFMDNDIRVSFASDLLKKLRS